MTPLAKWCVLFLILYVATLLAVGIYNSRKTRKARENQDEQYFLGGRKIPVFVLAISFTTASLSAGGFMGDPAMSATMGWSYFWIIVTATPGQILGTLILLRRIREYSADLSSLTIPEFLGKHYQSSALRIIAAVAMLGFYLFILVGQFKGIATLIESYIGLPFNVCLFGGAALILLLVILGGINSTAWADFIQAIPMITICVVLFIASMKAVGGFSGLEEGMGAISPKLLEVVNPAGSGEMFTLSGVIGSYVYWIALFVCQPYLCAKFMAVPDASRKNIGKFILFSQALMPVFGSLFIVGMCGAVLYPEVVAENPDSIAIAMASNLLPSVLAALMMIAILCAIVTTATSILLTLGQAVGNDIYRAIKPDAPAASVVKLTRISSIVIAGIVIAFNLVSTPDFLSVFIYMGANGVGSCIAVPLLFALYWKKSSKEGAIFTSIAGPVIYLLVNQQTFYPLNMWISCTISIAITCVCMILISKAVDKKKASKRIPA